MKPIHQPHIIIIEDNIDNVELITSMLFVDMKTQYFTVYSSGNMFFNWLHENMSSKQNINKYSVDLILLNLQLLRENGYNVCKKIKQAHLLNKTLTVAVTANIMQIDVRRARDTGFDGFIGIPINTNRFLSQIYRILAGESVWEPR